MLKALPFVLALSFLAGAALAQAPPDAGVSLGERIGAASAAAEALQGELDGSWRLVDAEGRTLYLFEFTDAAGGQASLSGAWRNPLRPPGVEDGGLFTSLQRGPDSLQIAVPSADHSGACKITLQRSGPGEWRGWLRREGAAQRVRLLRSPALSATDAAERATSRAPSE